MLNNCIATKDSDIMHLEKMPGVLW